MMLLTAALLTGMLTGLLAAPPDTTPGVDQPAPVWRLALRPAVVAQPADSDDVLRQAAQLLAAGAPDEARGLLERYVLPAPPSYQAMAYPVYADATYAAGD